MTYWTRNRKIPDFLPLFQIRNPVRPRLLSPRIFLQGIKLQARHFLLQSAESGQPTPDLRTRSAILLPDLASTREAWLGPSKFEYHLVVAAPCAFGAIVNLPQMSKLQAAAPCCEGKQKNDHRRASLVASAVFVALLLFVTALGFVAARWTGW